MSGLLLEAGHRSPAALALLIALLLALYLARPLQRLTEVARRMGAGELETRATGRAVAGARSRAWPPRSTVSPRRCAARTSVRRATADDVTHELRGALTGVFARVEALRHGLVDDQDIALGPDPGRRAPRAPARRRRRRASPRRSGPGLLVRKRPIDLDAIVHACVAGYAEPLPRALDRLDPSHRAGARGRRSRAAGPGRRQPALQRAALHGPRADDRGRRSTCATAGRHRRRGLRDRHRARRARARLRPLLAQPRARARGRPTARASGWRSSPTSSARTTGASRSRVTRAAGPRSRSPCRSRRASRWPSGARRRPPSRSAGAAAARPARRSRTPPRSQ